MGLDMYLYRSVQAKYGTKMEVSVKVDGQELQMPTDSRVVSTAAYWRKVNFLHKWFVDKFQDGVDECQESEDFHIEELEKLANIILEALGNRDPELLPPQAGFFFGPTDVDEWYWESMQEAFEDINRVIDEHKAMPEGLEIYYTYQSSW